VKPDTAVGHHDHKHGQGEHFDHLGSPEFEIHRPHRESRLYQFLMEYKLRRALALLPWPLTSRRVLSVCCGSGMDADLIERTGATVVALDISRGALLRAQERARVYGLHYRLVRGDAENLPFRSDSFDIAFVHDGLHHLAEPTRAIAEMARVACKGVVITEPADALLTKVAIALGVIPAREDSGNLVLRFDASALRRLLYELGFSGFASVRYLVKYGHPPARWWQIFNHPATFHVARMGFLLVGVRLLGRFGNKLSVAAVKPAPLAHSPVRGGIPSS
jgi:ubiquinone/menaquinone biosynthesis C-methylase UbiE